MSRPGGTALVEVAGGGTDESDSGEKNLDLVLVFVKGDQWVVGTAQFYSLGICIPQAFGYHKMEH